MTIRALIADDHELFRDAFGRLLVDVLQDVVVREAASFDEALEALSRQGAVDLLFMDLCMPGLAGSEDLATLSDSFPETRLVVVSSSESRADILSALDAGAWGYIPKTLAAPQIAAAIQAVIEGRIFVPAALGVRPGEIARAQSPPGSAEGLTARQREVLRELLRGQSSKQIARALGIVEGTVKIHLAAIYRALGVRSRAEAIAKMTSGLDRGRSV